MSGGKILAVIAGVTWLLVSPALCRGNPLAALKIYAAAEAAHSEANSRGASEQQTPPKTTTAIKPAAMVSEQQVSEQVIVAPETPSVVYVFNKSAYNVKVSEIQGSKFHPPWVVLSGRIKPLGYAGYDGIRLQAQVYDGRGRVVLETPVEDFSNGAWVWIFYGTSVERTRDISILPGTPPLPIFTDTAQQRPVYQEAQYQQPIYQQQAQAAQAVYTPRAGGEYKYSYFDIFGGQGSPNMALEFSNPYNTIYLNQLGLSGPANGPYQSVKWDKLKTAGFGPVGIRFGGYDNGNVGGALEIGMEKRNIKRQTTTFALNDTQKNFRFVGGDYLSVTSVYAVGNLMFRFPRRTRVEPYIGVGLGISLNRIHMPHVGGLKNASSFFLTAPTDDTGAGFVFNVPLGVRLQLTQKTQMVAEMRYQVNRIMFDRGGISGEKDTLTVSGVYFNLGMGFNF